MMKAIMERNTSAAATFINSYFGLAPWNQNHSAVDAHCEESFVAEWSWDWKYLPTLVFAVSLIYAIWILFCRPFNLVRDYSDYGYEQLKKDPMFRSNVAKRNAINEFRARRKVGELPPSYPNGWFAILESENLPVKTAKEVDALGLNLVAWRGESGKCFVADAYCPHLGAHLGVGGTVERDCIRCPFHNWSFEGCDGKLVNIPYADSTPEVATIHMYKVIELHGFIYFWYHSDKEEPTWAPDVISEVESNSWKYRGRSEFRVSCHIQDIPENGADISHISELHSTLVLAGTDPENATTTWPFLRHVWSARWEPLEGERSHQARLQIKHHVALFNKYKFCPIDIDVYQVGPSSVYLYISTPFGRGVLVQTVTPLEPLLQKVTHRFYSSPTFIHPLGQLFLHGEAVQISRDVRIWNRKTFIRKPVLTKEDKQIKTFRRWYSQFYSKGSMACYQNSSELGKKYEF